MRLSTRVSSARVALVVLAFALVAAGCGADETADDEPADSTTTAAVPDDQGDDAPVGETPTPRFVPGPCPSDVVPEEGLVRCGHVVDIPLAIEDPSAGTHEIAIAQTFPRGDAALADPILRLQGGPGEGIRDQVDNWLREDRIERTGVVLADYRGLGESTPRLDCPEKFDALRAMSEAAEPFLDEVERIQDAMSVCKARAEADGIDLANYDTAAIADDIEAVRIALEVDRWNLVGISYGTTVALEVMRRYPDSVRSSIIDSAYPGTRNTPQEMLGTMDYMLGLFDADCPPESDCNPRDTVLSEQFHAAVERLDASPTPVEFDDPISGEMRTAVLNGGDFANAVWAAVCCAGGAFTPIVPAIIRAAAEDGDIAVLAEFVTGEEDVLKNFAFLMSTSVECRDRAHLIDVDELAAILDERPEFSRMFLNSTYVGNGVSCEVLDAGVSEGFTDPIVSDIATLVLAGRYDSITPPYWGEDLLEDGLSNARFYEFPGQAHATWDDTPCAESISYAFQADPQATLDDSCIADMPRYFPGSGDQTS
ncbi:MAG: alpha/beta fold hydrolase [Actinomycetota bacterium]